MVTKLQLRVIFRHSAALPGTSAAGGEPDALAYPSERLQLARSRSENDCVFSLKTDRD